MRKIKITKLDMYGFTGRDHHPERRHEGMTGVVLSTYWEKFNCDDGTVSSTWSGTSKRDLLLFARDLMKDTDEEQLHYEVMTVYLPETDEIVDVLSFETEAL